ncbi:MAG: Sensory box histidine kinase [Myxococcaceae bacterium]|nr:Sensory box histidine kinase [Myxococcaceae bacterium]
MTCAIQQLAGQPHEQAQSRSLAFYQGLLDAFQGCLLCVDAGGIVCFANRHASELLASTGASLEGSSFLTLPDAKNRRELAQAMRAAEGGECVRDLDTSHQIGDRAHTLRWTLTLVRGLELPDRGESDDESHHVEGPLVLAAGIDVTDRLEHERRNAEDDAMAVMGTLAAGLAHEIRNPLNAATLQLELLLSRAKRAGDQRLQSQLAEPAALIRRAIGRLSLMLDEFLHVARPREPVRTLSSVAELFETVLAHKRPLMDGLGITLQSYVREQGLSARWDSAKIKQVVINLVRNSIDALGTRGYGNIELHAERRAGGGVSISVLDDGPGLAGDMRGDAAFQPFSTTKAAGTGLGLPIARKIVSQHGGTIELSARPGVGTAARFWISD